MTIMWTSWWQQYQGKSHYKSVWCRTHTAKANPELPEKAMNSYKPKTRADPEHFPEVFHPAFPPSQKKDQTASLCAVDHLNNFETIVIH